MTQFDPNAMPVHAARAIVQQWAVPIVTAEWVALRAALNRVLAEDISSPINVPAYDNAAMDGYAFDGAVLDGYPGATPLALRIAGHAFAGHPFEHAIAGSECVRIMTGAAMPAGCDTVVPQEYVTRTENESISFDPQRVARGAHCRHAGEDLAKGHPALRAGRILRSSDLGLLASLGIGELRVRRRLRVAFLSTGDELRSIGEPLPAGCVYDSNRYTLFAMLERLNVETLDLGVIRDDPAALQAALRTAAQSADVVLSSGGVSVGEADFTRKMLQTFGDVTFWSLAMRPGRPLAFGRIWSGETPAQGRPALFFGLPGNPVAVMVTFYQIVRDALIAMSGAEPQAPTHITAASAQALSKRAGRTEFLRGVATRDAHGRWQVVPTRSQSSGVLSSMSEANCFVVLASDQTEVAAGEAVNIMLFDGLI
jgi:molybdopterin molybdotransferase